MFRALLAKDLRRAWLNPVPWLVNLALPLCITALIGLAFGGRNESDQLGRTRFAIVDEDGSMLTDLLHQAAKRDEVTQRLEPLFLNRETALRQINANEISAVVIIPKYFTRDYLAATKPVTIELIKNPAESIHPAVIEELFGTLTAGLNAVSRNFQSEFPAWAAARKERGESLPVASLIERAGKRVEAVRAFVYPPLVGYGKETHSVAKTENKSGGTFNLFAFLLVGMAGMFLLFLAGTGMTDLHRELRIGTFDRYRTLHQQLLTFLISKVVFAVVLVFLASAILLAGGGLIFHIHWQQPLALALVTFSYTCFAVGVMALLAALVRDERQVNTFNYIVAMSLAIPGGCLFPSRNLPEFMRQHITPLLPSAWFTDTARDLASGGTTLAWISVSLKLVILSAVLIAVAAHCLRRRFEAGVRA